jgi:hypothetical protein
MSVGQRSGKEESFTEQKLDPADQQTGYLRQIAGALWRDGAKM